MNNRQKAKRFKMLYEDLMKKPVPVKEICMSNLKHYAATYLYSPDGADTFEKEHPWITENHIKEELMNKFSEIIKRNVEKETITDDETNVIKYRLDIWLKE